MHKHAGKSSAAFFHAEDVLQHVDIKDKIVLDAGTGTGHVAIAAARQAKKVYAADIHKPSIGKLKQKVKFLPNVIPVLADLNQLAFPDNSIDVTFLINVLHGFVANGEEDAIKEIKRVSQKIVVVEFKKDVDAGPPQDVKLTYGQIERIFGAPRKKFDVKTHFGAVYEA